MQIKIKGKCDTTEEEIKEAKSQIKAKEDQIKMVKGFVDAAIRDNQELKIKKKKIDDKLQEERKKE